MEGSINMISEENKNIQKKEVAHIDEKKCIGCGSCKRNCEFEAIVRGKDYYIVNEEKCVSCKVCASKCPADAITYGS